MSTVTFENATLVESTAMADRVPAREAVRCPHPVTQYQIDRINAENRVFDQACTWIGSILLGCVAASVVVLAGWLCYSLAAEMSSWSLGDFLSGVCGYRVVG